MIGTVTVFFFYLVSVALFFFSRISFTHREFCRVLPSLPSFLSKNLDREFSSFLFSQPARFFPTEGDARGASYSFFLFFYHFFLFSYPLLLFCLFFSFLTPTQWEFLSLQFFFLKPCFIFFAEVASTVQKCLFSYYRVFVFFTEFFYFALLAYLQ